MSRKNDREREQRRQRKQQKRKSKRKNSAPSGGTPPRWPAEADPRARLLTRGSLATMMCVSTCEALLGGEGRFEPEDRQEVLVVARRAGGIWLRLPFELESFLYEGSPWSLTCADLEPVRGDFAEYDADEAFDRLWILSLTNEPDGGAAFAAAREKDCAHRAALAFQALRACLDDVGQDPTEPLASVAEEMGRHGANASLKKQCRKLLASAVASVHVAPRSRTAAVGTFARNCAKLVEQKIARRSSTAWWQCCRLFLAEVFDRHADAGYGNALAGYPALLAEVFDAPRALVWMAHYGGAPERLRSVPFHANAATWLSFLRQRIDPQSLVFEDRLRYEIVRLRLLHAEATRAPEGDAATILPEHSQFVAAFTELRALLAHGVPSASRALPGMLEAPLVDFYVGAVSNLHCDAAARPVTEELLRRHPDDFRLACLYVTVMLLRDERHRLQLLAERPPRAHVDAELFAQCARRWADLPRGARLAATVRPLLFDCLDRQDRKQCLLRLGRQALWRATNMEEYGEELRHLLPYFERDTFVYREIEEKAALESGLIFLATMMAPLHDTRMSLDEAQSQQWVSYARQIAQQAPLGAQLATRYLRTPSKWFTLAPNVVSGALARLHEFSPSAGLAPAPESAAPTAEATRPTRPRRAPRPPPRPPKLPPPDPSAQRGLFDELDP